MATVIDSKAPPSTGPPSSHNSSFQCTGEAVSHLGCKLSFLNPELLSGRETLDWKLRAICVHPTHPSSHRPPGASMRCTDGRSKTPPHSSVLFSTSHFLEHQRGRKFLNLKMSLRVQVHTVEGSRL